jgi:hypothetical protein
MIANKLNLVRVWTPGSNVNNGIALGFWSYVFKWEGKATSPNQRRARFAQVYRFLSNLKWDAENECAIFDVYYWGLLNRMYKSKKNHPGHRFFQALQGHVWKFGPGAAGRKKTDRPWKWVTVPNQNNPVAPFKGMHW